MSDTIYQYQPWPIKAARWLRWRPYWIARSVWWIVRYGWRVPTIEERYCGIETRRAKVAHMWTMGRAMADMDIKNVLTLSEALANLREHAQ